MTKNGMPTKFAPQFCSFCLMTICLVALLPVAGCTSWSGGFPLQNPARVPAPVTGSYPQPGSYYQNNGAAQLPGTATSANFGPGAPPNGTMPNNSLYGVQPANYQAPITTQNGSQAAFRGGGVMPATAVFPVQPAQPNAVTGNRYPTTRVPVAQDSATANLQWQN